MPVSVGVSAGNNSGISTLYRPFFGSSIHIIGGKIDAFGFIIEIRLFSICQQDFLGAIEVIIRNAENKILKAGNRIYCNFRGFRTD